MVKVPSPLEPVVSPGGGGASILLSLSGDK